MVPRTSEYIKVVPKFMNIWELQTNARQQLNALNGTSLSHRLKPNHVTDPGTWSHFSARKYVARAAETEFGPSEKHFSGPPVRTDGLKIFTLHRKE